LYWLIDCYFLEDVPYSFSIERAMEKYGGIENYEIFDRIDPEFTSEKILLVKENEDVLVTCSIKTRKMLVGFERYYANGGTYLVNDRLFGSGLIGVNYVDGGGTLSFSNIWYGIIYPENREMIRINGKVPYFRDILFNGLDFVFWYIETDGEEANLSFEMSSS